MSINPEFQRALTAHAVSLSDDHAEHLAAYCEQLWNWNDRLNLTRHTDYESFVTRDLIDSQQLAALLNDSETVLDVGSGGGVPGIVLGILRSDLAVTLAESTQKKAAALQAIAAALSLSIPVLAERGEDVLRRQSYDTVTARAIAPVKKLLPWFQPQQKNFRRLLLIKGPRWREEVQDADEAGLMKRVEVQPVAEYATPGRDGKSVILEVRL